MKTRPDIVDFVDFALAEQLTLPERSGTGLATTPETRWTLSLLPARASG